MSDNLQLILRAVQEFDISVARAVKLIEIDREGEFNYDLLPYDAGTQAIFSFDEIPVQKYRKVLAERDALVKDIRITNKNLLDTQEAAKIITKQAIAAEAERDALVNVERGLRRMLCPRCHETTAYMDDGWMLIETAPKDKFVLLCGPSGYTTTPLVFTTGIMRSNYHAGKWIDHANDDLVDWGFEPTHWMPLPTPPES